jgi:hypothetical protein
VTRPPPGGRQSHLVLAARSRDRRLAPSRP